MRWDNNVRDIIINKGGVNLPKFLQKRKKRFNIFKKRCYFFSLTKVYPNTTRNENLKCIP